MSEQKQAGTQVQVKQEHRLSVLMDSPGIKKRFEDVLGKRSNAFISSVISAVNGNTALRQADPMSIISSAAVAASLDLPINPSLGFAHIVPYSGRAQFQIGWKGYVQLALRTGQYKTINLTPVLEGQLKNHSPFTGEMEFQQAATSDKKVGYLLYFKLVNGYEKYFYMTTAECAAHGKRFSRSFDNPKGLWKQDFDSMALKTVAKQGLSKYGVLSVEMQQAMHVDQGVIHGIDEGADVEYVDAVEGTPEAATEPQTTSPRLAKIVEATETTEPKKNEVPI